MPIAIRTARRPPIRPSTARSAAVRAGAGWRPSRPARSRAVNSVREGGQSLALTLVIGNKNYSSWSLRPWIAMKVAGIAFEEVVISLDATDFKSRVSKLAGTRQVPPLADDGIHVWE